MVSVVFVFWVSGQWLVSVMYMLAKGQWLCFIRRVRFQ